MDSAAGLGEGRNHAILARVSALGAAVNLATDLGALRCARDSHDPHVYESGYRTDSLLPECFTQPCCLVAQSGIPAVPSRHHLLRHSLCLLYRPSRQHASRWYADAARLPQAETTDVRVEQPALDSDLYQR